MTTSSTRPTTTHWWAKIRSRSSAHTTSDTNASRGRVGITDRRYCPAGMPGRVVWIEGAGGTPLCADLYLPAGEGPFAPLLEALPYRKDDVTASYRETMNVS